MNDSTYFKHQSSLSATTRPYARWHALALLGALSACDDEASVVASDSGVDDATQSFDASTTLDDSVPTDPTTPTNDTSDDPATSDVVDAGGVLSPDSGASFSDAGDFDAGTDAGDASHTDASDASYVDAGISPDTNVLRPEVVPVTAGRLETLQTAPGFELNVFAAGLGQARMLATWGSHVYVTRPVPGDVMRLTDTDEDGAVDLQEVVVSGLEGVHGIVFEGNQVFLATPTSVLTAAVDVDGNLSEVTLIIDDLPDGGQHPNRTLGIGPDGLLYISVGSSCDACAETNPEHATILQATLDGAARTVFASGLRNTIGFDWHPTTGLLWGMDHGSDNRGNDVPPEELNAIVSGQDYGWPYCYGQQQSDPIIADPLDMTKDVYCALTAGATLQTQAHNAPIGLAFYSGSAFPEAYQGDAFVAMHGSWNRIPATGYKVVRVSFDESGQPSSFEDFVTGFLIEQGTETFGRPAGITQGSDDSLLFSDDANGLVYRVQYVGEQVDAGAEAGAGDSGTGTDASADGG